METPQATCRLAEIATVWDQVREVQTGTGPAAATAVEALLQRYGGAVRRYLLAAVHDETTVADLTQEFALALVQSRFRRADPKRGRFRDYLKGLLFHLVSQYRRRQKKQRSRSQAARAQAALASRARPGGDDPDRQFQQSWRDELLARAWAGLVDVKPEFFTVLHFRAAHPDLSVEQMAAELQPQLGRHISVDNLRQMLHRARKVFADLLLADVSQSLHHPTVESVQQELRDLELLPYFQAARGGA